MCCEIRASNPGASSFCNVESLQRDSKIFLVMGAALTLIGVIFAGNMIANHPSFMYLSQWSSGQIIFFTTAFGGGSLMLLVSLIFQCYASKAIQSQTRR